MPESAQPFMGAIGADLDWHGLPPFFESKQNKRGKVCLSGLDGAIPENW
jgi:hypothetical protein